MYFCKHCPLPMFSIVLEESKLLFYSIQTCISPVILLCSMLIFCFIPGFDMRLWEIISCPGFLLSWNAWYSDYNHPSCLIPLFFPPDLIFILLQCIINFLLRHIFQGYLEFNPFFTQCWKGLEYCTNKNAPQNENKQKLYWKKTMASGRLSIGS